MIAVYRFLLPLGIVLCATASLPASASAQSADDFRGLGQLWFSSGIQGHFADPLCEDHRTLMPTDLGRVLESIGTARASEGAGPFFDTGGLLAPHAIARFGADRDPLAMARLVQELGYTALAFGEDDLGAPRAPLINVYGELRTLGVPVVASNLRCAEQNPLCDAVVDRSDGVAMFNWGEQRVAFLSFLDPESLGRVAPESSAGVELMPIRLAMTQSVRAARSRGATVVIASIDDGHGAEAASRAMTLMHGLSANDRPDLILAAGAGEEMLFARPSDFRPAIVGAPHGGATRATIQQRRQNETLDVVARPVPLAHWASRPLSRWVATEGEPYCALWGESLPGARLESPIDRQGFMELTASIVRDETRAEVVLLNEGLLQDHWEGAQAGTLTRGDVGLVIQYDEPLVSAAVTGRWLERLARTWDPARLHALGMTVTRTATATKVKVGGRPVESRGRYRLTTLRFLAAGGDGLLEEGPDWQPVSDGRTLRQAVIGFLSEESDVDPRSRVQPDLSLPVWTIRGDTNLTFSASATSNPGGYSDSLLQASATSTFGIDSTLRADLLQRLWGWENTLQLRYRTNASPGGGFDESLDVSSVRTSARWRGLRIEETDFYRPEPYFEGYLETELSVPEDNEFHHLLMRPTLGLQFSLTRLLLLKVNGGFELEALDPGAHLGPGVGLSLQLKPWIVLRDGTRRIDLEWMLDYFAADLGGRDRQTLRGQLTAGLTLSEFFALGLTWDVFAVREGGSRISATTNTSVFFRVSWMSRLAGD